MTSPDYQGSLGFEVVTLTLGNGTDIQMLRETGADDRVATLEERVLWDALAAMHKALQMWMGIHNGAANFAGKYGRDLDAAIAAQQVKVDAAASAARAALAKVGVAS